VNSFFDLEWWHQNLFRVIQGETHLHRSEQAMNEHLKENLISFRTTLSYITPK